MNVLIIEDESPTAELLKEMIESHPDYLVISTIDSVELAVPYLSRNQDKIDLLFMDIQLADGICFDIFKKVDIRVPVVFCTAYDEYALKAFQSNGIAYLLKPFREEDISQVFEKLDQLKNKWNKESQLSQEISTLFDKQSTKQSSFLVKIGERMIPIAVKDIALFSLENSVVYLFDFQGKKYPIFKSLDTVEVALDEKDFFRVNRQMMVHRKAIKEILPYFNRKVLVNLHFPYDGDIIVSRLKVTALLSWIERA